MVTEEIPVVHKGVPDVLAPSEPEELGKDFHDHNGAGWATDSDFFLIAPTYTTRSRKRFSREDVAE